MIPVTGKVYTDLDKGAMMECLLSGEEITYGTWNVKFEKMLREYIGTKYAYFVNSGSSANLIAFMAFTSPQMHPQWRVFPGDEIITVAAGFPTTVAPIVQFGAVPVFVDIELGTYNINTAMLEQALSPKTKGIMIAHTLGNPFDVYAVKTFCNKHGLFLIEDNSDALGSSFHDQTGSFGDVSTSSFYPAHHLSTGQGGAVFTDDPVIAKILLSLRNWGKECSCQPNQDNVCGKRFTQQHGTLPLGYDHKYVFSNFGYNVQGTNLFAALGCSQMKRIDTFTSQRIANFNRLYSYLTELSNDLFELPKWYVGASPSWFGFPILLDKRIDRSKVIASLEAKGIGTRTLFAGNILRQPCFFNNNVPYRVIGHLPITDLVMNQLFWVGCYHGLTVFHMDKIGIAIKEALDEATT